ncbi:threonine/serine exporter family protein, partial [Mycobacterium tuberculosis]|nr:threonine/serine exporter family protein [Mycobacterium tuberculosis]
MIEDLVAQLPRLAHQAAFGAVAAVGFGVLFNFGWRRLVWCAAAGALALGVRTYCQDLRWSLEAA